MQISVLSYLRYLAISTCLSLLIGGALNTSAQLPPQPEIAEILVSFDLPEEEIREQVFLLVTQTQGTEPGLTDRVPIQLKEFRFKGLPGQEIELSVEAESYWGSTHRVALKPGEQSLVFALRRAGRVEAELQPPRGEKLPEAVEMMLEASTRAAASGGSPGAPRPIPSSRQTCPIVDRQINCQVPAGRLDLRLTAEGYAPLYLWDIEATPGQTFDAGEHVLQRGGSVIGRLKALDHRSGSGESLWGPDRPKIQLELSSAGAVGSPAARAQLARRALAASAGSDGFFVLTAVPAGEYRLRAEHPSAGTAVRFPVVVREGLETRLPQAVELQPPASLQVSVFPATDPRGRPWEATILAMEAGGSSARNQLHERLRAEGSWASEPLEAGSYKVILQAADGSRWAERDVTLSGRPSQVEFFLDAVEVEGTLSLAGLPVEGTLWFGGRRGMTHVRIKTDENGRFRGVLPRPGRWRYDVATDEPSIEKTLGIEIEAPPPGESARLEIDLGAGRVEGEVLDENGEPASRALVWFSELTAAAAGPRRAFTDENGEFVFEGVQEGDHFIRAYHLSDERQMGSPEVPVEVRTDEATPRVTVRLQAPRRIEGTVVAGTGPVAGASLLVSVGGSGGRIVPQTRTDAAGFFRLDVPPDLHPVPVTVAPPGAALTCVPLQPGPDGPISLPVPIGGGTLRITVRSPEGEPVTPTRFTLTRDGAPCSRGALLPWLKTYGEKGESLTFRRMAPGLYEACLPSHGEEENCQESWLAEGGEVSLDLPTPPNPPDTAPPTRPGL